MPFEELTPRPFTSNGVETYAPAACGVYGISNAREWIYIGAADDIQRALLAHLADRSTSLMRREPTGFVFEQCERAGQPARLGRLLFEYEPKCDGRASRYQ